MGDGLQRIAGDTGVAEGESLEAEHGDNVVGNWVELVLQEGLDLWHDVVDVGTVEVGVGHHVGDHLVVSADVDLLPGFDQRAEHDPVVLVEGLDLKGEVFQRSLPVAHEEIILVLDNKSPVVNENLVNDKKEVRVIAVSA